jgi:hypothetical protein
MRGRNPCKLTASSSAQTPQNESDPLECSAVTGSMNRLAFSTAQTPTIHCLVIVWSDVVQARDIRQRTVDPGWQGSSGAAQTSDQACEPGISSTLLRRLCSTSALCCTNTSPPVTSSFGRLRGAKSGHVMPPRSMQAMRPAFVLAPPPRCDRGRRIRRENRRRFTALFAHGDAKIKQMLPSMA